MKKESFTSLIIFLISLATVYAQEWMPLGADDFKQLSFSKGMNPSLAVDTNGIPYIAIYDCGNNLGAYGAGNGGPVYLPGECLVVKRFNGTYWENVGNPMDTRELDLSQTNGTVSCVGGRGHIGSINSPEYGKARLVTLKFDPVSNYPYISFSAGDVMPDGPRTYRYFDGDSWIELPSNLSLAGPGSHDTSPSDFDVYNGQVTAIQRDALGPRCLRYNNGSWSLFGSSLRLDPAPGTWGIPFFSFPSIDRDSEGRILAGFSSYWYDNTTAQKRDLTVFVRTYEQSFGADWQVAGPFHVTNDVRSPAASGTGGIFQSSNCATVRFDHENNIYVAYSESRKNYRLLIKKLVNNEWQFVGDTNGISLGGVGTQSSTDPTLSNSNSPYRNKNMVSLQFDQFNNPFVCFVDAGKGSRVVVKRFENGVWDFVGDTMGVSPAQAEFPNMVFTKDDVIYVSYQNAQSGKAFVRRLNGQNWDYVGESSAMGDFPEEYVTRTDLALDYTDKPYLAYVDRARGNRAVVMRYEANSWSVVGNPEEISGQADSISIEVSSSGHPIISFKDLSDNFKAKVYRFNGNNWQALGASGASSSAAFSLELEIDNADIPHIAYLDPSNNNGITCRKFIGGSWVDVGTPGFPLTQLRPKFLRFSIDPVSGIPHVAFSFLINSIIGYSGSIPIYGLAQIDNYVMAFSSGAWSLVTQNPYTSNLLKPMAFDVSGGAAYVLMNGYNGDSTKVCQVIGGTFQEVGSFVAAQSGSIIVGSDNLPKIVLNDPNKWGGDSFLVPLATQLCMDYWQVPSCSALYTTNTLLYKRCGGSVFSYDGSEWVSLPSPITSSDFNFSATSTVPTAAGEVMSPTIRQSSNGDLYIAYSSGFPFVKGYDFNQIVTSNDGNLRGSSEKYFELKVFPNPSSDRFTVEMIGWDGLTQLTVVDAVGRIMLSSSFMVKGTTLQSLDLSHYPSGFYMLRLQTQTGTVTRKLVKE